MDRFVVINKNTLNTLLKRARAENFADSFFSENVEYTFRSIDDFFSVNGS